MTPSAEFEQLFAANYDAVYRYALRRVPPDVVQDVVAETFLVAWRRFGDLRGEPVPWLIGIARRVAANHLRSAGRRAALAQRLASETRSDSGSRGDGRVLEALARLPERDREALMLVAWDGLANREAAAALGCSATAFAVRLHRARRRLEQALRTTPDTSLDIGSEASVNP